MKREIKNLVKIIFSFTLILFQFNFDQVSAAEVLKIVRVGIFPDYITVNPTTNTIYVSNRQPQNISVIDGSIDKVINTITPNYFKGSNDRPEKIIINPNTNRLYVATNFGKVLVIDGSTYQTLANIEPPIASYDPSRVTDFNVIDLAVNPNTNKIYFLGLYATPNEPSKSYLAEIDGQTNSVIKFIEFKDFDPNLGPSRLAINPDTNKIYITAGIAGGLGHNILIVDIPSKRIIDEIDFSYRSGHPYPERVRHFVDIAINTQTNKIYLVAFAQIVTDFEGLIVIDGNTNDVIKEIKIKRPFDLSLNPNTNVIYVIKANFYNPQVPFMYIIDGNTNSIIKKMKVNIRDLPADIDVNPITNKAYVTFSLDSQKVVVVGE